ncbi:MAG: hypothetical protein JWO36_3612 [Myxococcales bacterium]|nr:hypothetical protein [Myxococcales bacterium]
MKAISTLLLIAGCASQPAQSPQPRCEQTVGNGVVLKLDDAALQTALDQARHDLGLIGGAAEVRLGCGTWRGASGTADLATGEPLALDAAFRIGSITKTVTSTVVLQLVDEGRLALDDTLEHWYPGYPGGSAITIRQLLSHTSGIAEYSTQSSFLQAVAAEPLRVWQPRELIAYAAAASPRFVPGTSFEYCNTGYVLAGLVIEAVTGRSAALEIRERVLVPAGVTHTWLDGSEAALAPINHAYAHLDSTGAVDLSAPPTEVSHLASATVGWTAGALAATPDDLVGLIDAIVGPDLLSPDSLAKMKPAPGAAHLITTDGADFGRYGLGLIELDSSLGPAYGHGGDFAGFLTYAIRIPAADISFVVLLNDHRHIVDLQRVVAALGDALGAPRTMP